MADETDELVRNLKQLNAEEERKAKELADLQSHPVSATELRSLAMKRMEKMEAHLDQALTARLVSCADDGGTSLAVNKGLINRLVGEDEIGTFINWIADNSMAEARVNAWIQKTMASLVARGMTCKMGVKYNPSKTSADIWDNDPVWFTIHWS